MTENKNIELKKLFLNLGEETKREYEVKLTEISNDIIENNQIKQLENYVDSSDDNSAISYAMFYCLTIIYRRSKDFILLNDLFNQKGHLFNSYKTFGHINILFKIEKGDMSDPDILIDQTYLDGITYADNAGFVHLFTDTVASCFERISSDNFSQRHLEWLDKALNEVDKAIILDSKYAKYHSTKGRLLALNGNFDEAIQSIELAISMEKSSRRDYSIRISNYQNQINRISFEKQNKKLKKEITENMKYLEGKQAEIINVMNENLERSQAAIDKSVKKNEEQIEGSMLKNMEFIGLFSGVVSFTIAGVQILQGQEFLQAAKLIIVLMGCLLFAFSGLSFVIGKADNSKLIRCGILFLIGIISILGGISI